MPGDVISAIQAQNTEVAAGQLGQQPMPPGQMLSATVTAQSRLQTPQQFRDIILKTQASGATVRLADVAQVELGAQSYNVLSRIDRKSVGWGKSVSVSVDLGGSRIIKKKNK